MAGTEINVDPKILRECAQSLQKVSTSYKTYFEQATQQNQRLKDIWQGAAATAYITNFQNAKAKCDSYLQTLETMVHSMYESADAYEQNINAAKAEIENLPKLPSNTMR